VIFVWRWTLRRMLDAAIRHWRAEQLRALSATTFDEAQDRALRQAADYIDAFQSVRVSMLGAELAPEETL
jgi:hypothetical protein